MSSISPGSRAVPELSVVIVTYNGCEALRATLESLVQCTRGFSYELIIVDNASPERCVEAIVGDVPQARLIKNRRNIGFAAANDRGIEASRGRYVALLNPDTLLQADVLSQLVRWLDVHPDVGAVGPQLRRPDGSPQPYSHGATPTPLYLLRRIRSHVRGSFLHTWQGEHPLDVDWVAGTCLVARRDALLDVGGLDERFFLYFEDVDLGVRLRHAGWRVVFLPTVTITHIGGASVGKRAARSYDRSLVWFYRKHYGSLAAFGVWLALRLYRKTQRLFIRRSANDQERGR